MKLVSVFFVCIAFSIFFSCTRDMVMVVEGDCQEEITYDQDIRPIVNATCAYSGCHNGSSAPGNFTNYEGISKFFDSGLLARRVTISQDMPPDYATQGPTMLNEDELEFFKCWVEAGYPEN
jgi:hypothetical protein